MKLRHLEIFYAVMTCGSLSRAAEALNISQPAASKALKSAEMKLGFTLFQRVRGKLLPTSEAITLSKSAEHLSGPGQPAPAGRQPGSRSARQDHFRLSAKPGVKPGAGAGDRLLSAKQQPGDDAHYRAHRDAGQKLDLREIDLALTLQPVQQGEILTTLIAEVPLVYIDRHYRQGAVEIVQIDQQRWISPGPHSLSAAIATRRDFSTTRLNVQTYYMATEFVKRGMGCSITDIFSAQHNLAPEMIHPITPPMAINLCLLRRADVSLSPMAQKFVDFLCQRLRQQLKEINLRLYPDHKKSIAPLG